MNLISEQFDQYIYLNLEQKEDRYIFEQNYPIKELIQAIFFYKDQVKRKGEILISIDEIQACPSEPPAPCSPLRYPGSSKKRMDLVGYEWKSGNGECIGYYLTDDLFFFREDFHETDESIFLERNIIDFMPRIVTSLNPLLRAAKINIQQEFARAVESIRRGREYDGKNLFYIAGLNIDISEYDGFPPTTYFVPWAAHIQLRSNPDGDFRQPVEQEALYNMLMSESIKNPDETNLKEEIARTLKSPRFDIRSPK